MGQRLFGIILLALGVVFLLDTLGVVEAGTIFRVFWPLILVIAGVLQGTGGSWVGGGILIAFGGAFLLQNFGVLPGSFVGMFWPLAIIAIGAYLLLGRRGGDMAAHGAPSVRLVAMFSGSNHRLESQELRRAELSALFGGLEVDLRLAHPAPEGALVDVGVLAGGVKLRVPETWRLSPEAMVIFGAIEDKRFAPSAQDANGPRLIIRGFVAMGGIEVVS